MPSIAENPGGAPLRVPRLRRHLAWILIVKFALLAALWQVFVKPYRVQVDLDAMAARLTQAAPSATTETQHDRSHTR